MGAHWFGQNYIACKGDGTTTAKGGIALSPKEVTCRRCRRWIVTLMGAKRFDRNWTTEDVQAAEINNNPENTDMPPTDPTTPAAPNAYNCANCNKEQKLTIVTDQKVFCDEKCMLEYVQASAKEQDDMDKEIDDLIAKEREINSPKGTTPKTESKTMPDPTPTAPTNDNPNKDDKTMTDPTPTAPPLFTYDPENKETAFHYQNLPAAMADWKEAIVFSYMGKDDKKVIRREEMEVKDLMNLFETILNNRTDKYGFNPIHQYVSLTGDVTRMFVYAVDRKTKKATHTLIELKLKGKGDKARVVDTCHSNPRGKGNHPNMVALGVAFSAFKANTNDKESDMEKKNVFIRMAHSVKDMAIKFGKKMMGWARSFMGWNIEQRYAILGSVSAMYGGMWFWYLMGGALPIYVFGVSNILWVATCVGFLASYAILAYLSYAAIYAVVAGLVALKNTVGEFMALSDASVSPEMTTAAANA